MIIRLIINFALLISVLVLPYWFYLPMIFIAILFFPFFWEALIFALLIEVLYGEGVTLVPSLLSLAVFFSIVVMIFFRERIRLYV